MIASLRTKLSLANKAIVPSTELTDINLSKKRLVELMSPYYDVSPLGLVDLPLSASYRLEPSIAERVFAQLKDTIFLNSIFPERPIDKSLVTAPVHFSPETVQLLKHSQLCGFFTKRSPLIKAKAYKAVVQELRESEDSNIKLPSITRSIAMTGIDLVKDPEAILSTGAKNP